MKNFVLKTLVCVTLITLGACQNDQNEIVDSQEPFSMEVENQLQSVKDVSDNKIIVKEAQKIIGAAALRSSGITKRVGCILDSDVGCGSESSAEIEEYVNLSGCITFSIGTLIIPLEVREFTYTYSYYVDGDGDINMDRYQFQFDAHVADIASRIAPQKIVVVNADASSRCNERAFNTSSIKYTVILGN